MQQCSPCRCILFTVHTKSSDTSVSDSPKRFVLQEMKSLKHLCWALFWRGVKSSRMMVTWCSCVMTTTTTRRFIFCANRSKQGEAADVKSALPVFQLVTSLLNVSEALSWKRCTRPQTHWRASHAHLVRWPAHTCTDFVPPEHHFSSKFKQTNRQQRSCFLSDTELLLLPPQKKKNVNRGRWWKQVSEL